MERPPHAFSFVQTGSYLLYDEGVVTPADIPAPSNTTGAPSAANATTASPGNSTAPWLGCVLANVPALMDGTVLATLDGIASPEACCRECQARVPACNVWNACFKHEGCRWAAKKHDCLVTTCLHMHRRGLVCQLGQAEARHRPAVGAGTRT